MELVRKKLISRSTINKRIKELAKAIKEDYGKEDFVLVCTLTGAFHFYSKLIDNLGSRVIPGFISATSYDDMTSNKEPKFNFDKLPDVKNKRVLIIEDIIDTGITLAKLSEHLSLMGAKDIKYAVLLNKEERRENKKVNPDYILFDIPNRFVIGFGLDYNDKYRNLHDIECFIDPKDKTLKDDILSIESQLGTKVRR